MQVLQIPSARILVVALSAGALLSFVSCGESQRPIAKSDATSETERDTPRPEFEAEATRMRPSAKPVIEQPPSLSVPASTPGSTPIEAPTETPSPEEEPPPKPKPLPAEVEGLQRLMPDANAWLDVKNKRVVLVGEIVRREGQLEMFACLKNSKEHESIVAVKTKAFAVNAALIALGATPGHPVQFRPEFKPAKGPEVAVTVAWTDDKEKRHEARAQDWIRHIKTGKTLEHPWVFGGSGFWVNENTGEQHFMAEDGDFVCISNFTSAMIDLPVESSQASSELEFEAFTERIPPVKTQVIVYLTPKLKKADEKPADEKAADEKANAKTNAG